MSYMSRPTKTRKINHNVCNSTSIENLDDKMLRQILFRLPSCASVLACTPVNKRWYSLISNPRFAAQFSDHKTRTRNATLSKSRHSNIHDNEPKWTHLITKKNYFKPYQGPLLYCVGDTSANKIMFNSPKFKLDYLPRDFEVEATFMDLLLCSNFKLLGGVSDPIYYVTNPITKQWVALPPCRGIQIRHCLKPWAALVCRHLHDYKQDYQFRVVLINDQTLRRDIKLSVYCSEIGQWKKLYLHLHIKRDQLLARTPDIDVDDTFQCVVCNGKIYLHHQSGFAAFNPFDVDDTTENSTVIDAEVLPSLQVEGILLESSGNLFLINNPKSKDEFLELYRGSKTVSYKFDGHDRSAIEMPLIVWKLNPNQVPLKWLTTFKGTCRGNVDMVERTVSYDDFVYTYLTKTDYHPVWEAEMHPKDDTLIYVYLPLEHQFVFCDTRSRSIKPLKRFYGSISSFHRFELQWWPTSVPRR